MPVDTPHPSYSAMAARWRIVRDCLGGAEAIRAAGATYLPKLSDQEDDQYQNYKLRATFFAGTGRTGAAMTGFLFRKPPTIKTSLKQEWQDDVDLKGNSLVEFAKQVGREIASVGRAGTMIDWSEDENRPYCALYLAEDILNWRVERKRTGGKSFMALTLLVLVERGTASESADEFAPKADVQYRVLRLRDEGATSQTYRPKNASAKGDTPTAPGTGGGAGEGAFDADEETLLMRRGTPLTEIPFVFHNSITAGPEPTEAPLYDIAEVNVAHFRNSADLENGRHMCGVPTPYAIGWDNESVLYLGASKAWVTERTEASCGFIEVTGAGIETLAKGIEEKERQMAALGARLIEPPKADAEAFETVQLRASAETASLASIASQLSNSMTEVLSWLVFWSGNAARATTSLAFEVTKEFTVAQIDAPKLTAMVAAWQQGAMSWDTLYWNFQRSEIARPDIDAETEREEIEANPPMPTPATNPTPPIDPNRKPPAA